MKIACDLCQQMVDDSLLQILEEANDILYVCPECYLFKMEGPPEEQP
ncbi:MAG: hypothetical protein HYZ90_06665 [Candidatus Omnitrophica bacterium]|nr:hypothetical protein [Candidatus Omnitrophota bacterium]